jgi:hypothetical protein
MHYWMFLSAFLLLYLMYPIWIAGMIDKIVFHVVVNDG